MENIKEMASRGMNDKDIIKELKRRGYGYDEIEKGMLGAVRDNVGDDVPAQQNYQPYSPAYAQPQTEDLFSAPQAYQQPAPEFEFAPEDNALTSEDETAVLEELIEGVIEDKWHDFEDRFSKMETAFDQIKSEIKLFQNQVMQQKSDSPAKEMEVRFNDLSQQLEDLDARVGGLEKAFKQFLPSLTRNIESLSHIIHEMKEKGGHVEIEEEM